MHVSDQVRGEGTRTSDTVKSFLNDGLVQVPCSVKVSANAFFKDMVTDSGLRLFRDRQELISGSGRFVKEVGLGHRHDRCGAEGHGHGADGETMAVIAGRGLR